MSQTNTRQGDFQVRAGEDLPGKEDCLVKLINNAGTPEVKLPEANSDYALFLLTEGDAITKNVTVRPIEAGRNVRIRLKGTCIPGDSLVLADVATAVDKGKVRVLPTPHGTYRVLAIAEEAGVDGQTVLCRPAMIGNITV
jgi:hypothetical protein